MSFKKIIKFSQLIGKLKGVKRTGWISQVGVHKSESVADHSYRCAILGMCIGDLMRIDCEKLLRMLLLHDVHEAVIGDYDLTTKKEMGDVNVKSQEQTAIQTVLSLLPVKLKDRYLHLWNEFEKKQTFEAKLAHEIDKLEMVIQALDYKIEGYDPSKLETFWRCAQHEINTPILRELFNRLKDELCS